MTKSKRDELGMGFATVTIGPGEAAIVCVEPLDVEGSPASDGFVTRRIDLEPGLAERFEVVEAVVERSGPDVPFGLDFPVLLPASEPDSGRYPLTEYRMSHGWQLVMRIRNRSAEPGKCFGVVVGSAELTNEVKSVPAAADEEEPNMTENDRGVIELPGNLGFSSETIRPGDRAEIRVDPFAAREDSPVPHVFTPRWIELAAGSGEEFEVVDVAEETTDCVPLGASLLRREPAHPLGQYELDERAILRGRRLLITVRNSSIEPGECWGSVVGRVVFQNKGDQSDRAPAEDADPPSFARDLLEKCRRWFLEGVSAAFADHQREHEDVEGLVEDEPPPGRAGTWLGNEVTGTGLGIRRALRELVVQAVAVAEIPLAAAQLYWAELLDLKTRESRGVRQTVIPVGPVRVKAGEEVSCPVEVLCAVRPTELHVYSKSVEHFELVDVRVGKNCQMVTNGAIPCTAFLHGTPGHFVMEEAGPGRPITLRVKNTSQADLDFEAFVVGVLP